jgi:hypothetical protein
MKARSAAAGEPALGQRPRVEAGLPDAQFHQYEGGQQHRAAMSWPGSPA